MLDFCDAPSESIDLSGDAQYSCRGGFSNTRTSRLHNAVSRTDSGSAHPPTYRHRLRFGGPRGPGCKARSWYKSDGPTWFYRVSTVRKCTQSCMIPKFGRCGNFGAVNCSIGRDWGRFQFWGLWVDPYKSEWVGRHKRPTRSYLHRSK